MIKIENLSKYYYNNTSVTCALRQVSLELKIGEFVAITGESGSGKTTLLNVISGVDSYEDGEMYINNQPTSYFDNHDWENYRKNDVAFIFQNYNLIESYTVIENVIAAFIIDGLSIKEAKPKARELLKLVGLEDYENKKAAKLSGGQKQRLSIARALAKKAKIIVADEPTGNLDSENGKMIIELLKKVSKDKLIIIVTHNQEEVESYATRKIRLHDGEIVYDEQSKPQIEEKISQKNDNKEHNFKDAFSLFKLNFKSQPRKTLLLLFLITTLTFAMMAFLGTFASNYDDAATKVLKNDIFMNHDDRRILVRNQNGNPITDDDLAKVDIPHVIEIEPYDYITDVNYFRPTDYKMEYISGYGSDDAPGNGEQADDTYVDNSVIKFTNYKHYMRSGLSLKPSALKAGRLPTNNMEMVVYSSNTSLIGTKETVYFCSVKDWGNTNYVNYDVTIVGILKTPTEQAYFSDDICQSINIGIYSNEYIFSYRMSHKNNRINAPVILLDPDLPDDLVSLSKVNFTTVKSDSDKDMVFTDITDLHFNLFATPQNPKFKVQYNIRNTFKLDEPFSRANYGVGISYKVLSEIMELQKEVGYSQFAIFIDDYAYTDDVINQLAKMDFQTISCYRASVTNADSNKLLMRFITLSISIVSLILIFVVEIALCYSILKIKKNDFLIFKIIGLKNSVLRKTNYIETFSYGVISYIIVFITCIVIKNTTHNDYLINMFKYIRFYHYLILLGIVLLVMYLTVRKFNKYLVKNTKVTLLKED